MRGSSRTVPAWIYLAALGSITLGGNARGQQESARAASETRPLFLVMTADVAGTLEACGTCPSEGQRGGAARWRSAAAAARGPQENWRETQEDTLWIDAGAFLFGASDPERVAAVYGAMGFDAVHISPKDFRLGAAYTREIVARTGLPATSANLTDDVGEPLFAPFLVREQAGAPVAIIGVSESPAALAYLPALASQLKGVTIQDPLEALERVLPEAEAAADRVVLVVYGSMDLVDDARSRFGDRLVAVCCGGVRPAVLNARAFTGGPPCLAVEPHGVELGVLSAGRVQTAAVEGSGASALDRDPRVTALLDSAPADEAESAGKGTRNGSDAEPAPQVFASGKSGAGRGLWVTAAAPRTMAEVGDRSAPPGQTWVTFALTIENDIPLDLAFSGEREAGEKVLVALKQNLFLVHRSSGAEVYSAVAAAEEEDVPGGLPLSFQLTSIGASASGTVAFPWPLNQPLPEGDGDVLALWLDHDEFPPAIVRFCGELDPLNPVEESRANDYLALAPPSFREAAPEGAPPALPGQRWLEITLQGTSCWTPFEGRTKPASYLRAHEHLQLVVDGQWSHLRAAGHGTLAETPVFLPSYRTGGTAYFLVPRDTESLALHAYFPLLQGTDLGTPAPITFQLDGEPAPELTERALAVVDDEPVDMAVVGARWLEAPFDGAQNGEVELELDVRLVNAGAEGGELRLEKRFLGDGYRFLGAFGRAGIPITDRPLLPAGARRAIRVRLAVPEGLTSDDRLEMDYSGITVRPRLSLEVGAPGTLPVEVARVDVAAPEDAPDAEVPEEAAAAPSTAEDDLQGPDAAVEARPLPLATPLPSAANDAARLSIESARLLPELSGVSSRKDQQILLLETRWRLVREPEIDARGRIEPYEVQQAGGLYVVHNGRRLVAPAVATAHTLPGAIEVPSKEDRTAYASAWARDPEAAAVPRERTGAVAYVIPRTSLESLSLHLLDPRFGNLTLRFFGEAPALTSPFPTAKNRAAEIRVASVEPGDANARGADRVISVDLRGTSLQRAEPLNHGGRSEGLAHGITDAKKGSIHLLFNGDYPVPTFGNDLSTPPIWLPDASVGGVFQFRVPAAIADSAKRIELVICLGDVAMPGEPIHRTDPLIIPIADGPQAGEPEGEPLWSLTDDSLRLTGFALPRTADAAALRSFVRVRVENLGSEVARLDPAELFAVWTEDGKESAPRNLAGGALELPFDVRQSVFVPGGARRTFDLAFQTRAPASHLRYAGLLRSSSLPLTPGATVPPASPVLTTEGVLVIDRERVPLGIDSVGLRGQDVNRAIDTGRDWMMREVAKRFETESAPYFRHTDLPMMLALVHAGAHLEFPEFAGHLDAFLSVQRPSGFDSQHTYRCGLLAMLLDALDDPSYAPLLRDVATYLVNAQSADGTWPYDVDVPPWMYGLQPLSPEPVETMSTGPLTVATAGRRARPGSSSEPAADLELRAGPLRRRVPWHPARNADNSLAQYALLGLHACEMEGIRIDPEIWRRSLSTIWRRQSGTGGWAYTSGRAYGSMTCAGDTMVAIAMRALEPERDPALDPRVQSGCGWLANHWTVDNNPDEKNGLGRHLFYHYYGVERTGRLLDTEFYGSKEWYPLIARRLVDTQTDSGAWPAVGGEKAPLTTAFAVLFLTRATESLDPATREAERAAREAQRPTLGRLEMRTIPRKARGIVLVLDASGSMLAPPSASSKGERTPKFEHARAAILEVVERLPEGAPAGLVVYGHRLRAREKDADKDVEVVVPVGPLTKEVLRGKLAALRARGRTPLALALKEAQGAFRKASVRAGTVVLLTDGGQGREPGDPVEAAEQLRRAGYDLEIIAFDMDGSKSKTVAAWNAQIEAMARAAEGRWVSVASSSELAFAVVAAATGQPRLCEVRDASGALVYSGEFEGTVDLKPGTYDLKAYHGSEAFEAAVVIERGRTERVQFDSAEIQQVQRQ